MVHPVGRRSGDYRRAKPARPLFPRRGKGKEKRITSRARFPARPKRLGIATACLSLPFETLLESADLHVENAGLYHAFVVRANKGQIVGRQFERYTPALPRLQRNLRESLQSLVGRRHAREALAQVQLNDFFSGALAAILHGHVHVYGLVLRSRTWCNMQIGICETRITQSESKFELRRAQHLSFSPVFPFKHFVVVREEPVRPAR